MTVPNPAQERVYPLPAPADDRRFTLGLVFDICRLLEAAGYPPIESGGDLVALQQALYGFLYTADPTGYGYSRPTDPPADPVPPHVEGHPTTGRDDGGLAERFLERQRQQRLEVELDAIRAARDEDGTR